MTHALPTQPRVDAVSFDLDGTLVDTAGEIAEAANRTIAEFGLPAQPPAAVTLLIGHGARALLQGLLAGQAAAADLDAALARFEHHYQATTGTRGQPYAGCAAMLQRLRGAGVRLACVTNKESRLARQLLQRHHLAEAFDLLIGGDTLPQKKPDPRVLVHTASALGVEPARMAHVGDSAIDVQAARGAGVAAWAVPWGYNGGRPIEAARPDRVFRSLPAVADHVLGHAGA
jgi:phosphoglycolate phosphatase